MNEHERTRSIFPPMLAMFGLLAMSEQSEQPQRHRSYSPPLTPDQRRKVDKKNRRREISKASKRRNRP